MKEEKAEKKGRDRERGGGGEVNKRREEDWKEMGSDRGKKKKGKKEHFYEIIFSEKRWGMKNKLFYKIFNSRTLILL